MTEERDTRLDFFRRMRAEIPKPPEPEPPPAPPEPPPPPAALTMDAALNRLRESHERTPNGTLSALAKAGLIEPVEIGSEDLRPTDFQVARAVETLIRFARSVK